LHTFNPLGFINYAFQPQNAIIKDLRSAILRLEGFKHLSNPSLDIKLGPIVNSFPNSCFPLGVIHEFLSPQIGSLAATSGFVAGLQSAIVGKTGVTLWICSHFRVFPPALKSFGLQPDHIIFLDLKNDKDVLWTMEEALKCDAISVVVGEMDDLDFKSSRRLQLATEQSKTTGMVIHTGARYPQSTACTSRLRISPQIAFPFYQGTAWMNQMPFQVLASLNGKWSC